MKNDKSQDLVELNRQAREIWNQNARFWDEKMGDGNQSQRLLTGPASERLLGIRPGEWVLEIACGNGVFSRRMAQLGAHVVATDFSEALIEAARARSSEFADRLEYRLVDATVEDQLLLLGERRFDAAACSMGLMDMASIEPLMSALNRLLKPGGRFVFSVTHPCFNTTGTKMMVTEEDRDGELLTTYSINVAGYLGLGATKGIAIVGQPAPHLYFNRTLTTLFNSAFRAGFVMEGIEEPAFDESAVPSRPFSWVNFREIPPFLVARMRLRGD